MLAAEKGFLPCCLILLAYGADLNLCDNKGKTALHYACQNGFSDVASKLLDQGSDSSILDASGMTPVHLATIEGHNDCVKLLLNRNPQFKETQSNGEGLLSMAAKHGNPRLLEYLFHFPSLQNQSNLRDKNGKTPLHHAIENENEEGALVILSQPGIDCRIPDDKGNFALHFAAWYDLVTVCQELLKGSRAFLINHRNFQGKLRIYIQRLLNAYIHDFFHFRCNGFTLRCV